MISRSVVYLIMASSSENNFYRLIALLIDVAYDVVREYFKKHVLGVESFESFLTRNLHQLYHLYKGRCCQCSSNQTIVFRRCLSEYQFKLLIDTNQKKGHSHDCTCKFTPQQKVSVAVLDISLAYIILKNCSYLPKHIELRLNHIKKVRNELVHKSDVNSISIDEFKDIWQGLSSFVIELSLECDSSLSHLVSEKISTLYERVLVNDDMLKKCIMLHDWWKEKCLEMEIVRQEHFDALEDRISQIENTAAERHKEQSSENLEKLQQLDNLTAKIDKIQYTVDANVAFINLLLQSAKNSTGGDGTGKSSDSGKETVPIMLMVDVPDNWDKSKLINAMASLQNMLSAVEGKFTIRSFSTEEVKMLLDMKQTILQNPEKFKDSLYGFMTTLVKESNIDSSKDSNVKLKVKSMTEKETMIPYKDSGFEFHKNNGQEVMPAGAMDNTDLTIKEQTTIKEFTKPKHFITHYLNKDGNRVGSEYKDMSSSDDSETDGNDIYTPAWS